MKKSHASRNHAVGAEHSEELAPQPMETVILSIGRQPEQRTSLYEPAPEVQHRVSYNVVPLLPISPTRARKRANISLAQSHAK